jgi:very-short-patch-repair endonuclease
MVELELTSAIKILGANGNRPASPSRGGCPERSGGTGGGRFSCRDAPEMWYVNFHGLIWRSADGIDGRHQGTRIAPPDDTRRAQALVPSQAHTSAAIALRRQAPIGSFVVDFVCHEAKLVVEVDGSHHGTAPYAGHDDRRTLALTADGYRVLRFWNREVLQGIEVVLDTILAALDDPSFDCEALRGE